MSKIFPLQSLRGICVLVVMIVHFNPYKGSMFHIQTLASAAVFMFLVLSGFIISMIYDKKILMMTSSNFNIDNFTSSRRLSSVYKRTISRLFELTSPNFNKK